MNTYYLEVSEDVLAVVNDSTSAQILEQTNYAPVRTKGTSRGYIPWGDYNTTPQEIVNKVLDSDVMSPNMFFNILTCYGRGMLFKTAQGEKVTDNETITFFKRNRPVLLLWEAITDIKFWNFAVFVIVMNKAGDKIVQLLHKDAMFTRFEACNPKTGKIEKVLFANWENRESAENPEAVELLDTRDPWGDLMVKLGRLPDVDGQTRKSVSRKFAYLIKIPVPGNTYYPLSYWMSTFRSGWYDLSVMVPRVKKSYMKQGMRIRYQVEIDKEFWTYLYKSENIIDPEKQQRRRLTEIENIRKFLSGLETGDKIWFSGFYIDPNRVEHKFVRITVIDTQKPGGDWIEDAEEAANFICYAQGVHPHLNGATPGKNKGSQSGSDKRELFTMKQSLEKPVRDLLLEVFYLIADVNGWDVVFEIPDIMLTTLDKGSDAKEVNQYEKKK